MTVRRITHKTPSPSASVPAGDRRTAAKASPRRDLVAVDPTPKAAPPQASDKRSRLTDALFVAHLFATKFQAPQTREKRRAEPAEAEASYRKAAQARAPRPGRVLSRKV